MMGKIFHRQHSEFIFFLFYFTPQKTGSNISCKLIVSLEETICKKCQILFSGEKNKNVSFLSAKFALRLVKIKGQFSNENQ